MNRREFIALLGGAAVLWPLAARAQQPKIIRLGYLEPQRPTEAVAANLRRQFLLGLRDLGYVEGRHFKMEDRSANGQLELLGNLASELARLPVDLFVAGGDAPILAAMRVSDTIPIVMTLAADPIRSGFIQSLARPGGNVTGMSALASDMAGKRLELLKEAVPRAQRVAVLWNSDNRRKSPSGRTRRKRRARSGSPCAPSRRARATSLRWRSRQSGRISRMRCLPLPRVLPSACASGSEALPWPAGCR